MRETVVITSCIILLGVIAHRVDNSPQFVHIKQTMQSHVIPTGLLNYGTVGKIVRELGLVKVIPNDYKLFKYSKDTPSWMQTNVFWKKRIVGKYLYASLPGGSKNMPSSLVMPSSELKTSWDILSIVVEEKFLRDEKIGIITNYKRRGKKWERLAYVSYYENGVLLFSSGVGLRLHGGGTDRRQNKSFRLYFRKEYGVNQFKPGILFGVESEPIKTLVVRKAWYRGGLFTLVIAHEFAKRIGAQVGAAKLVKFFVNGIYMGIYTLTEHISPRQWASHMNQREFYYHVYKKKYHDRDSEIKYSLLKNWIKNRKHRMRFEEVNRKVDLENFSLHLFTLMFLGTTDWRQGMAILPKHKGDARWSWVIWDLDHSFQDVNWSLKYEREPWEQECIKLITKGRRWDIPNYQPVKESRRDLRNLLFNRLVNETSEYREYFVDLVTSVLNHRLTPGFLAQRAEYYVNLAKSIGCNDVVIKVLPGFAKYRPAFVRENLKKHFNLGEIYSVKCKYIPGIDYIVDGYNKNNFYEGSYFQGQKVKLEILNPRETRFKCWLVNGEPVHDTRFTHVVNSHTIIEPVIMP